MIIQKVQDIVSAPLSERLDLKHLFLLTGIIIVFSGLWAFILAHIKSAAMELVE